MAEGLRRDVCQLRHDEVGRLVRELSGALRRRSGQGGIVHRAVGEGGVKRFLCELDLFQIFVPALRREVVAPCIGNLRGDLAERLIAVELGGSFLFLALSMEERDERRCPNTCRDAARYRSEGYRCRPEAELGEIIDGDIV